ncbi:MAG: zinc ribbon domain-containing protein [Actinobacteria bacterium]|nr:zinc ribbon domain-containing protein [Actinomycetota bacterium]
MGQRFCRGCGAAVQAPPAPPAVSPQPAAMPACPACATPFTPGQRFCRTCGTALVGAPVQPAPVAGAPLGDHVETYVPSDAVDDFFEPGEAEVSGRCEVCAAPTTGAPMCAACSGDMPRPAGAAPAAPQAAPGGFGSPQHGREDTMIGLYARSLSSGAPHTPEPAQASAPPTPPEAQSPPPAPVEQTAADLRPQAAWTGQESAPRNPNPIALLIGRVKSLPPRNLAIGGGAVAVMLVVAVLGVVLLAGGDDSEPQAQDRAPVTGSTDSTSPTGTVRAHWEAIAAGDYPSAYAQLSSDFRDDESLDDWASSMRQKSPGVNLLKVQFLRALDSDNAEVAVEVVTRNADEPECVRFDGRVRVVKENDVWRYWAGGPGDTFTRRETVPASDGRCAPLGGGR